MHDVSSTTLRAVTGLAVAALVAAPLAGCSGASSALPGVPVASAAAHTSTLSSLPAPDAKTSGKSLLYVSDNANNKISVFDITKKQGRRAIRTITAGIHGPNGIATDKSGNLYVANYASNTVTVYPPNAGSPALTISNGLSGPWDLKVDGFGNVWVANVPPYGNTNFVNEYPAGATSPSVTWAMPAGETLSGITLLNPDLANETSAYALEYTSSASGDRGGLVTCYPGELTCSQLNGYTFGPTGGIATAESPGGNTPFSFICVDQFLPGEDVFTPGHPETQLVSGGTPEFVTLDSTGRKLFVADRFTGIVTEYSYPGEKVLNTYAPQGEHTQIYGVATYPSGSYH